MAPRTKHAPLTKEQREYFFQVAAEARIKQVAVEPALRAAWQERYGEQLRASVVKHYAYDAAWRPARAAALRDALDEPALLALVHPGVLAMRLHELAEDARRGIVIDVREAKWQDPAADGAWRTKAIEVIDRDLTVALEAYRTLISMGENVRSLQKGAALHDGSLRGPVGKARPTGYHPDSGDQEEYQVPRDVAAMLIAQENKPFQVPPPEATLTPYEVHLNMMRRWETEGVPPPGMPARPTKRVLPDGTVEDMSYPIEPMSGAAENSAAGQRRTASADISDSGRPVGEESCAVLDVAQEG